MIKINQQDFDEAIKNLPSPAEIEADRYAVYNNDLTFLFIFRKEVIFITPQRVTLTMWVLDSVDTTNLRKE